jgi:hypothetical protein
MANLTEGGLLRQQLLNLATDIRELRKEVSEMRTPTHTVYIQWLGLVIVGGSALWALAIQPLKDTQRQAELTFAAKSIVDEKFLESDKASSELREMFKGVAMKEDLNRVIIDIDRRLPRVK